MFATNSHDNNNKESYLTTSRYILGVNWNLFGLSQQQDWGSQLLRSFFQANIKPSLPSRSAVSITWKYLWIVHQSLNFWRVWCETFPKTTTPQEFVPGIQIFYPFQLLITLIIREYEHVEASPRCWQASPFSTSQTYLEEKDSKSKTKKYVDLSHLQKGLEASKSTRRQKLATSAEVDEHKRQLLISFWTTDDARTLVESHSGRWWRRGAWWRAGPGSPWRRGPRGASSRGLTSSD